MNGVIKKVTNYFLSTNLYVFIFSFLTLEILVSYTAILTSDLLGITSPFNGADLSNLNYTQKVIIVVIIGPIIETAIFQYGIIKGVNFFIKKKCIGIIISATCFGLAHQYSLVYFITGIVTGFIFAICFTIVECRRESSFVVVALIHSFYNLFVLVMQQLPD